MKKIGFILLLLILAGFGAGCINSGPSGGSTSTTSVQQGTSHSAQRYVDINGTKIYLNEIHFYMYGLKTCPHCRRMHELIPATYGNDSLTYYELVNNDTNVKFFSMISQLTGITGVPAIAITYRGNISAIIEGEFNVTATPRIIYASLQNNGTLLFVGGKAYILPHNSTKAQLALRELYDLFVKHEMPTNSTSSG